MKKGITTKMESDDMAISMYGPIPSSFSDTEGAIPKLISAINAIPAGANPCMDINGPGGDVFNGYALMNAIAACKSPINMRVTGIAASMYSALMAVAGGKVTMCKYSLLMIHEPSGGGFGTADELQTDCDLLRKITDQMIGAYVKRTGKSKTEIAAMLKKTTWLTPEEALTQGFIDGIDDEPAIMDDDEDIQMLLKQYPKLTALSPQMFLNQNSQNPSMKKLAMFIALAATCGCVTLSADSTEDQVYAAFATIAEENKSLKAENKKAKEGEQKAFTDKVTALVDGAIESEKIKAEQKETFVTLATADYDNTKKVLDGIAGKANTTNRTSVTQALTELGKKNRKNGNNSSAQAADANDRSNWTFMDWSKKDPKGLNALMKEDKEAYNALLTPYQEDKD